MIIEYCRTNPVAITFETKEQFFGINEIFGYNYKASIVFNKGILTHYNRLLISAPGNGKNWYKDYAIINALEFFHLVDENHSILFQILKDKK
jgi:hypothetical protein